MPAFNSEKTISSSINSVLSQTYSNFELIICDDGSTDSTEEVIRKYISIDSRVKLIPNLYEKGAAGARNSCLVKSDARFVAFLDSDDLWLPEKLEAQVSYMLKYNIGFSHGEYVMFDKDKDIKNIIPSKIIGYKDILLRCDVGCLTVMVDRKKVGKFEFPISPKEDYALWVSLMKLGHVSHLYPGCLARYFKQRNSISSSKFKEISKQWYVLKHTAKVGIFFRVRCIVTYIFNGITKHFL